MSTEAETVYLSEANVRVTSARADFGGTTYATRHINSVMMATKPNRKGLWVLFIIAGLGVVVVSLIGFLTTGAVSEGSGTCAIGGLAGALIGLFAYRSSHDQYVVRITTSSGQVDALQSASRADIERIVAAITQAITAG